jgi:hypothetical protein
MKRLVSGAALMLTLALPAAGSADPKRAVPERSLFEAAIRWVTNVTGILPHEKSGKVVVGGDTDGVPKEQGSTTIDSNG